MATIKVKNVSARLYTNVGGKSIIPGEEVEVDSACHADIKGNKDLEVTEQRQGRWVEPKQPAKADE